MGPAKIIVQHISEFSNQKKARWLENYVKHDIKSRGVGIPEIRKIIVSVNGLLKLDQLNESEQITFLNELMSSEYTEDKLAAILYVQQFWKNVKAQVKLDLVEKWLSEERIFDWNVCDWMCVRLLSPLLVSDPGVAVSRFIFWNKSAYLWTARSSLVPFAAAENLQEQLDVAEDLSVELIKREERFSKTAVGWVLREISRFDQKFVKDFLDTHKEFTTAEVRNNALKYLKK